MKKAILFLFLALSVLAEEQRQFGRLDTMTLVTLPVDELGTPNLEVLRDTSQPEWVPPVVVPLLKIEAPVVDLDAYVPVPNVVWYADRVERQWSLRALTQVESARRVLKNGFRVMPENFVIPFNDKDRNQFAQMLNLVNTAQNQGYITDTTIQKIADASNVMHEVTTQRFKQIMVLYGFQYKQAWDILKEDAN